MANLLRDATGLELDHECSEICSLSVKIDILQRDLPLEKELKPVVTFDYMLCWLRWLLLLGCIYLG